MRATGRVGGIAAGIVLMCSPVAMAQDLRAGVEQLAAQIVKDAPAGRQFRVAVADFPDLQGVTSNLGRYVATALTTRFAQSQKFSVIERQRLGQVLAELKFSMSDLVDPTKAKQLGRMAGVEAIIVGTVSDLGNQVDLDARMIEIETNRMLLGTRTTISKDQVVKDLLEAGRQTTPSSVALPSSPASGDPTAAGTLWRVSGLQFTNQAFSLALSAVEAVGDELKFTFVYTNRSNQPYDDSVSNSGINGTYLVDDLGQRYGYKNDSFGGRFRTFAPGVPEQVWVSFAKPQAGASKGSLVVGWNRGSVLIRNIPLRPQ